MIRPIYFEKPALIILDQNQLPDQVSYVALATVEEVAAAIKQLMVRGAPLIGVTAAFGLALAMKRYQGSAAGMDDYYRDKRALLAATRPTAVNLFWALQRMDEVYQVNRQLGTAELGDLMLVQAENMRAEDMKVNQALGEQGQEVLGAGSRIMTICNAGALATCGYGTALGVIRAAARRNKVAMVWACETRPVLQGARLTVWELMQDQIPVTLVTDNMAAAVMQKGKVDAVLVGADRIAANGDTANKIGTYGLAVLAAYHGLPFYVAAPWSTIDLSLGGGDEIPIEERNGDEVRQFRGVYSTVPEAQVYNPAFDVTPQHLITGIITEKGIIKPPFVENLSLFKKDSD